MFMHSRRLLLYNTLGAYKIREYIIEKLTTNSRNYILFFNMCTHECMSENKYGHN